MRVVRIHTLQEFQLGKKPTYSFNKVVAAFLLKGEIRWEMQTCSAIKQQNVPCFLFTYLIYKNGKVH